MLRPDDITGFGPFQLPALKDDELPPSAGAGTLDTSATRAHTSTVTATSQDGLTASASITYTVIAAAIGTPPTPTPPAPVSPKRPVVAPQITRVSATGTEMLRTRRHGRRRQAMTTRIDMHAGLNRRRIAGRWEGHLVPAGACRSSSRSDAVPGG